MVSSAREVVHDVGVHSLMASNSSCSYDGMLGAPHSIETPSLDSIEDVLTRSLLEIRALWNCRVPINSLPPEVLTAIFQWVQDARKLSESSFWDPLPSLHPERWLSMTYVCRYWREVALGDPLLWTQIEFVPYRALSNKWDLPFDFLKRSAAAPLDVQVFCKDDIHCYSAWKELEGQCGRIRELHIIDLPALDDLRHLSSEAPLLESLCIRTSAFFDTVQEMEQPLWSDGLPLVFSGYTPRLRFLALTYFIRLPWNCSNLTSLHLSKQRYRRIEDFRSLLDLLRANSATLTEFTLSYSWSDAETIIPGNDDDFIHMHALRNLSFDVCGNKLIGTILLWLHIPSHSLAFACTNWCCDSIFTTRIFPADIFNMRISSRIYPLQEITKLSISYDNLAVDGYNETSTIRLLSDERLIANIMLDLRALLSFPVLQEIWLSGSDLDVHSWENWRSAFGEMTALTKMVLNLPYNYRGKKLHALSGDNLGARPFPAPKLRELWVLRPWPETWDPLLFMLQDRDQRGYCVHKLHILCEMHCFDARIRQAFDRWKDGGELSWNVDIVQFETVDNYPSIDRPPGAHYNASFM